MLLAFPRLVQRVIDAEAGRRLPRWKFVEGFEKLTDDRLGGDEQERAIGHPLVVEEASVDVATLEGIAAQVVDLRRVESSFEA